MSVRADAVEACATLADRYITGRFLPDKAIDLLDTSCARVKINLSAKPAPVEDLERAIAALGREKTSLDRDRDNGSPVDEDRYAAVLAETEAKTAALAEVSARWQTEKEAAAKVLACRAALVEADPAKAAAKKVTAEVVEQFKGPKQLVFKFKKRKNYKKLRGHRQQLTRVEIKSIA